MSKKITIFGVLCLLFFTFSLKAQASEVLEIQDEYGKVWRDGDTIAVFGADSSTLLFPNQQGNYQFTIKNQRSNTQDYQIQLQEKNQAEVPVEYQILKAEQPLLGATTFSRLPTSGFTDIGQLTVGQSETYQINWHWDGTISDFRDTKLGQQAVSKDLWYQLKLTVISQTKDDLVTEKESTLPHTQGIGLDSTSFLAQTGPLKNQTESATQPSERLLRFLPQTGEVRQYWLVYTGFLVLLILALVKRVRKRGGA